MARRELLELISHGREERSLEYKGPVNWTTPAVQARLIKCILAMSNIRDGGAIIIGVEQVGENFPPVGLSQEDRDSFTQDSVASQVAEYADPYVELTVSHVADDDGRDFAVIQVQEFAEVPAICKRNGPALRQGALYTRTRRQYECAEVATQSETREMVDLAVEKGIRRFDRRALAAGYTPPQPQEDDIERFRVQRNGL